MIEKEVAEIRRRFRPEKNNITNIRGCYVNEKREIVSTFNQSVAMMPQEESEKYMAIFKRTLSGNLGKNLIDIVFSTMQVVDSEEHKLLSALRNSSLGDEEAVQTFFQKVINSLEFEGNYLILLANDKYDVPYRAKDGLKMEDSSTEVFHYIMCSICPVKMTKPALSYYPAESQFHSNKLDWVVASPELGFLFPAFDDRSTNLYNALYYTRNTEESHNEFVDAVFRTQIPMPAAAQKETFQSILGETLAEECSYEVVQAVHGQLSNMILEHKANKEEETLVVSKQVVKNVLESCGVSEEHVDAFDERYKAEFGEDVELSPRNIVDTKQLEIRIPDVVIKVNSERSGLVETRVIDGKKYILICADEGVELNGINIHIIEDDLVTI
ncbi:MAG: DUF4317 domain-containing protein [Angelakisella sp.]|nr:DUF4317 domain-containing protein [Angelakisella sp.]